MSLAFLVPLFLVGLAGVTIPIVIHLTRKQRRNVVTFPSLMFLQKIPYQEQRRRRVQNWFLLLLRALALAVLAFAFARPFVQDARLEAAGMAGPRELVVLLDQSYSMGIGDTWQAAVRAAHAAFDGMGPLDRASVVLFDQGARIAARSTSDRARLEGAVDSARVGSGTTRYGVALKVAQTILEESTLPRGEVVLVSDFQRSGWARDEGVHLPAGTVVTPVAVQEDPGDNIEVAGVALVREATAGRERVTATARVVRQGGQAAREVPVTLELDGQELQQRTVSLEADGAAAVSFAPFTLSQPHTRGTVRVPADRLEGDDARYFVLSPGSSISVLLLEGGRARDNAGLYLERALETSAEGRFAVKVRRADDVRAADLDGTDVLVLDQVRTSGASAELLRGFVAAGGGVLVVAGEATSWPASGADLLPGTLGAVQDREEGHGGRLGYLDYGHQVFEIFAGPRSGDFSGARFFRARGFEPTDSAHVLARFDDGSVALAETSLGEGSVDVWTSTLDTYWNDLALQPVFLPFAHRLVEHLSGRTDPLPWLTVGQVVDLSDEDALRASGLVSTGAAGLETGVDQVALTPLGASVALPSTGGARYLPFDERGFYVVRPPGTDPARPFTVAVNVDLSESALARVDPEELIAQITGSGTGVGAGVGSGPSTGPSFDAAALAREDRERRQSLWRWLLLAGFALLLAETGLSNWISRRGRLA